jgi:hypothetical protein
MTANIPPLPANAFRITLNLNHSEDRLDVVLMEALKNQNENEQLKNISRSAFKNLFRDGKITIKGQNAKPSSSLAKGVTYVDIIL